MNPNPLIEMTNSVLITMSCWTNVPASVYQPPVPGQGWQHPRHRPFDVATNRKVSLISTPKTLYELVKSYGMFGDTSVFKMDFVNTMPPERAEVLAALLTERAEGLMADTEEKVQARMVELEEAKQARLEQEAADEAVRSADTDSMDKEQLAAHQVALKAVRQRELRAALVRSKGEDKEARAEDCLSRFETINRTRAEAIRKFVRRLEVLAETNRETETEAEAETEVPTEQEEVTSE